MKMLKMITKLICTERTETVCRTDIMKYGDQGIYFGKGFKYKKVTILNKFVFVGDWMGRYVYFTNKNYNKLFTEDKSITYARCDRETTVDNITLVRGAVYQYDIVEFDNVAIYPTDSCDIKPVYLPKYMFDNWFSMLYY